MPSYIYTTSNFEFIVSASATSRNNLDTMPRTLTILSHIVTFLAGIFITNLLSTYQLTSKEFVRTEWAGNFLDMSTFMQTNTVRGSTNQNNDDTAAEKEKTKLLKEVADLQKIIDQLQNPNVKSTSSQTDEISNQQTGICSMLPQPTPTALSMWSSHLPQILNSTQHPEDRGFIYRDFTALLLHYMTPDRMQRGVKTLPLDWSPVERGLDVVYKRLRFIKDEVDAYRAKNNLGSDESVPSNVIQDIYKNPKLPRPLNVLVMGGSVTMGVVCHINPVTQTGIARRQCAWPGRMTSFFSMLFGGYELVQFHTVAMGGTNTESGITMWDYSLLPGDTPYPDVVINAYAVSFTSFIPHKYCS
jgi:hypothetical protein